MSTPRPIQAQPPARWKQRPRGSNWGDFGSDDRLGRLNLITPERRLQAIAEAREGIVFCLSLPLDVGPGLNASREPPELAPGLREGKPKFNLCACEIHPGLTDVINDDWVKLYTQYSTQWDSLYHAGSVFDADGDGRPEVRYYNGFPAAETVGRAALGIEHMAASGVQGRGVMIDLRRHFGDGRTVVGHDLLQQVLSKDGIRIEAGDLVCLHTGFAQRLADGERDARVLTEMGAVLDGNDPKLLQWISDCGLAALIADNVAVEDRAGKPPTGYAGPLMPLHEHCLFKIGVHLGELWLLTPLATWLATNKRHRFLLTAPPLRLPGAAGSPVTPVATV
jgi:kynurenine formamidase